MTYQSELHEAQARNAKIEILAGWTVYLLILLGLSAEALANGLL
jgi:hypothetical protein